MPLLANEWEAMRRVANVKEQGSVEELVCLLAGLGDVGGFNLLIGDVREADQGRGLAIISNRSRLCLGIGLGVIAGLLCSIWGSEGAAAGEVG